MTPEEQLREVALRVTGPRVAVLTEVSAQPHLDVDTLTAKVRSRLGSVSTQAVYDVLRALTEAGLIRRIEPAGSPARFEARVGDNHHHVVCRECGDVADIDCATGSAPCLEASNANGFIIDEAEVTYWGICPRCQQNAPAEPAQHTASEQGEDMSEQNGSTTSSGAPAVSDRNSLTVGANGPLLLHDVHFLEQMAHFNRERVPERSPHAKGAGAFGVLEVTEDVSQYTKAALFAKGAKTDMLARFSSVAGEQGSPDTWRDPRGFALKFYTSEGNLDLVGNNTPIFFIRDTIKFPHFIRSQKRLPGSGLRSSQMQWDFWTLNPESAHQVTYLMGDRGIPKTWRHMNGYGSHTYMWINALGEKCWVKYHFHSDQGVEGLSGAEANRIAGEDGDFHRRDLYESIERNEFPSWTLSIQVMPYADAQEYRFNPFDLTKIWPHSDYPLIKVGKMTLNKNPDNFFAEIEQAAFSPGNTVPGIGLSPDKMLLGRTFAYSDAQRNRIGTNFHQLPVNRPRVPANTYMFDGAMTYEHTGNQAVYAPNSIGRPFSDLTGPVEDSWETDGPMVRSAYELHAEDDDFGQAGTLVREVWDDAQRADFIDTVSGHLLGGVTGEVLEKAFEYWKSVDPDTGKLIEEKVRAGNGAPNPGGEAQRANAEASAPIVETSTNAG